MTNWDKLYKMTRDRDPRVRKSLKRSRSASAKTVKHGRKHKTR